jgi:hypothetical protein
LETPAVRETLSWSLCRVLDRGSAARISANLELLKPYAALAHEAQCSMPQLALAWVLTRGDHVVAIPGTTSIAHLDENVAAGKVELPPDIAGRLDALINQRSIAGDRYNATTQAEIDTEDF